MSRAALKSFVIGACVAIAAPLSAVAQNQPGSAAGLINPFGFSFDKDPTKSDSEVRYNHQGSFVPGQSLPTDPGSSGIAPPSSTVPIFNGLNGTPAVTKRNAVSGIEWEDMNSFSKSGAEDYAEDKLHNEMKKPMPEYRPFGNRMKEISDELKGTTPD